MSRTDEIQARADKATAGPWERASYRDFGRVIYQVVTAGRTRDVLGDGQGYIAECRLRKTKAADAAFIAHAREDIPWLLAERGRLTETLREALLEAQVLAIGIQRTTPEGTDANYDAIKLLDLTVVALARAVPHKTKGSE